PLSFPLFSPSPGSLVQAASLSQPPSLSANVGETVKITCSGSSNSGYGWYQQKFPGSAPVTVIYYNDRRPSDIPSRFSGAADTLTITGVQVEDEAVYYCGGYDHSSTAATVALSDPTPLSSLTGQPVAAPSVYLFPPSSEEMSTQNKATVVCLLENFYPSPVTVTWLANGRTDISSKAKTSVSQRQSNNQYMSSSYLSLTSSEWSNYESVACKVVHEGGTVQKTVSSSECS
ncbi:IGL1 protein, partial [Pitta sordida]|nr:IGL1 protein [Pitta sordida]